MKLFACGTLAAILLTARISAAVPVQELVKNERRVDLPAFGLKFDVPAGWARVPEQAFSQLACFILIEDRKSVGLLEVSVIPGKGRSVEQIGATIAKSHDGNVIGAGAHPAPPQTVEVDWDGNEEFRAYSGAVFPVRDTFVIVSIGQSSRETATAVRRAILRSVVIGDPKPAADDLTLRKRPVPLLDSTVLLSLPEPFRPDKVTDPDKEMFWGVRDWVSGHDEASLRAHLTPNPQKAPLASVATIAAKQLTGKFKLESPMTFTKVNSAPAAFISSTFPAGLNSLQRIVYISLADDKFAVLILRTTAPDAQIRDRYGAMMEEVAREARISSAYYEARHEATSQPARTRQLTPETR